MSIPFCKFHGFGNDYLVIERAHVKGAYTLPDLAVSMCHRNTGVGSDGIAFLEKLDGDIADYSCQIVNPDGSFASFSGNGTRCAVAYLYHNDLWTDDTLRLKTRSGVKIYKLLSRDGRHYEFEAEIGRPQFSSDHIPVLLDSKKEHVIDEPVSLAGGQ